MFAGAERHTRHKKQGLQTGNVGIVLIPRRHEGGAGGERKRLERLFKLFQIVCVFDLRYGKSRLW